MQRLSVRSARAARAAIATAVAIAVPLLAVGALASPARAADSDGCTGGGYQLVDLDTGAVVAGGTLDTSVPASALGTDRVGVRGRYTAFDVRLSDFAVFDQLFTGAANPADMTGAQRTVVYASKIPDHRGLGLTSAVSVQLSNGGLNLSRTGQGLSMAIQAKDCAAGGIFQMEVSRGDGTRTRVTHTLADNGDATTPFFYDNPNFRAQVGRYLGADCTSPVTGPPGTYCVQVTTRVNIANDASSRFVLRDSSQVATRVGAADCTTASPVAPSVKHCGRVSVWDVASGGRLGFVTGEDATEVANPPTVCTHKCQAQNQVRGRLANLGAPFPVPAGSRLVGPVSALPLPPLTSP
jgi:hypothetical protein